MIPRRTWVTDQNWREWSFTGPDALLSRRRIPRSAPEPTSMNRGRDRFKAADCYVGWSFGEALLVVAGRSGRLHELRSCSLVMTTPAAKEHQGHEAASDDKR